MAHDRQLKQFGLATDFTLLIGWSSRQIKDKSKHVDPRAEDQRTRVQFPPPPNFTFQSIPIMSLTSCKFCISLYPCSRNVHYPPLQADEKWGEKPGYFLPQKGDTPLMLTDTQIRKVKSREKSFKLADGKGLFLIIQPNGSRYWRFRYWFGDKEKSLSLGVYPEMTLARAREKRDEARQMLADDVDPGMAKQLKKRAKKLGPENSFETIAREWHIKFSSKWTEEHGARILYRLEKDVFPWLGQRPISEILHLNY